MNARRAWRKHVTSLLDSALDRNDTVPEQVSAAMATAIEDGRHVYAFGAGHSLSLVSEMHRRAGSLKAVRPIWNQELTSREDEEAAESWSPPRATTPSSRGLDWGPPEAAAIPQH